MLVRKCDRCEEEEDVKVIQVRGMPGTPGVPESVPREVDLCSICMGLLDRFFTGDYSYDEDCPTEDEE